MKDKLIAISLIISFGAVLLQPVVPFVQYYFAQQAYKTQVNQQCDCQCEETHTAKMASNGDAFLRALIKRVCNDKKKQAPKLPVVNSVVFVKTLFTEYSRIYIIPENNYNQISDFLIQPELSSYIDTLLRPPIES